MARKLAVKRLTASDLTLFERHYRNNPAVKQKAFNLDSSVLVGNFYPQLSEQSSLPVPRYPISLDLLGPGGSSAHNLMRKILKQQKNWRLNGELIYDPDDQPGRYDVLNPGDYAFVELSGDVFPTAAQVILVAKDNTDDAALHAVLALKYPGGAMAAVTEGEVAEIVKEAHLSGSHPLLGWINDAVVEDAVLGGSNGIAVLTRPESKGLTPEEFLRRRLAAERTGIAGEEYVNDYFDREREGGRIAEFEWVSSLNAIAPFDFRIITVDHETRLLDVKSTSGKFSNPIHISYAEVYCAVNSKNAYDIYRTYNVSDEGCELRISRNVGEFFRPLWEAVGNFPAGIRPDSFSVDPELLGFSHEIFLLKNIEVSGGSL